MANEKPNKNSNTSSNAGAGAGTKTKPKTNRKLNIAFTIIAIVLIIVIVPLLVISVTLIVKGSIYDQPPDIFGYAPLTVASGSMSGDNEDSFDEGDLIFIKVLSDEGKQTLTMGDVVCYTVDDIYVTHRIVGIGYGNGGEIETLVTKGDANNTLDNEIEISAVFGIYTGKIKNLGSFAEFLQSSAGIVVFIGIPVIAFIAFDVTRIMLLKKKGTDMSEMQSKDEEIERLKKLLEEQGGGSEETAAEAAGGTTDTGGGTTAAGDTTENTASENTEQVTEGTAGDAAGKDEDNA